MKKRNLKGSVVLNPVPAVLVTCKNSEGKDNVFDFTFYIDRTFFYI